MNDTQEHTKNNKKRNKRILFVILIISTIIAVIFGVYLMIYSTSVEATMMFSDFTYGENNTYQERCIVSFRGEGGDSSFTEKYELWDVILRINMPSFCHVEVVSMNPSPRPASKPTIWEDYTYNAIWIGGEVDNDSIDYSTIDILWQEYNHGIYSVELLISWADDSKEYDDYLLDVGLANRNYVYVLPLERNTWNHNTDIAFYGIWKDYYTYDMYIGGLGKVEWNSWFDGTIS